MEHHKALVRNPLLEIRKKIIVKKELFCRNDSRNELRTGYILNNDRSGINNACDHGDNPVHLCRINRETVDLINTSGPAYQREESFLIHLAYHARKEPVSSVRQMS